MNRTVCGIVAAFGTLALGATAVQALPIVVFEDNFANNHVRHTDDIQWYWWTANIPQITESGGYYRYTATNTTAYEVNEADQPIDPLIPFPLTAQANPIRVSIRDMHFNTTTNNLRFSFSLMSAIQSFFASHDAVQNYVEYRPGTNETVLRVGAKIDAGNTDALSGTNVLTGTTALVSVPGKVTGWDMDITNSGVLLTVFGEEVAGGQQSFSGNFSAPFTQEIWNQAEGWATPRMRFQAFGTIDEANQPSIWLGSLTVSVIPEPASLGLLGLAGLGMLRRRRSA